MLLNKEQLDTIFFSFLATICLQNAGAITDIEGNDDSASFLTFGNTAVGVAAGLFSLLLIGVILLAGCMDCMNSEVSSESHPACGGESRKWGGASGNSYNPDVGFREVVNPSDARNQPLPYAMVPTQVPEQAGFVGYSSSGGGGLVGYGGGTQQGVVPSAPSGQPRHHNPMMPEEPPPAYGDAVNQR